MNEENQISYYAVIPATIRYDTRLKAAEKLIYGEIYEILAPRIDFLNKMKYNEYTNIDKLIYQIN